MKTIDSFLHRRPFFASLARLHPRRVLCAAVFLTLAASTAYADAPFVDNGDGTVTDTSTGLMWDQCALGLSGSGCATGTAQIYPWAGALGQAATQSTANYKGYSDWRLPSIVELKMLIKTGSSPTIDASVFPATPTLDFWSGSSYVPDPTFAWYVVFLNANLSPNIKTNDKYVRLVRGGQYFGSFALLPGGVSGTTATTATLTATSPVNATGYWLAIPRNATPPTTAQVVAGVSYTGVTVAAAANGAMTGRVLKNFAVSGLAAGTAYDLYLVAKEGWSEYASQLVGPVQFSTTAIATRSVVIDPATPTTLHAAVEGQGIYKSTDSGANWTAATTQPSNTNLRALVITPGDGAKLYAATYGGGVFKSTNSGATWSACASQPGNLSLVSLAIDATGKLYAGSEGGVYASSDACATWTAINTGLPN